MSPRQHFSRFFAAAPDRLHFAAHSHHPWPDVSLAAQQEAWEDAARLADDKWGKVFGTVLPTFRGHVARELSLPDPRSVAVAPNTHELVRRLLSCLPERPRVLTTDAEFHSFDRQLRRLEELSRVVVTRVPTEPFATFPERLVDAALRWRPELVFFSHVFFDSGAVVPELPRLVAALPEEAVVCVDGYHGYCAVPTDLSAIHARAFYVAGSYKYAMGGEGACFLHVPPGFAARPADTGWFAAFSALGQRGEGVTFGEGGDAFLGSTFDPTAFYRANAAAKLRDDTGLQTPVARAHAARLALRLVTGLARLPESPLRPEALVVPAGEPNRGRFLAFRTERAASLQRALHLAGVVTDARGDRLRFGFGVYQREDDVDRLLERLAALA